MSNFPYSLDTNETIYRVDNNITEISGTNFNQIRDAIFKIEAELGIKPAGTLNSLTEFLDVSFNKNGTIKTSALASIGLVTLPIDNSQVGINAGIIESKLSLDYSTASLFSMVQSNASIINSVIINSNAISTKLTSHIGGGPSANLRHVASHIDINAVPNDSRDPGYVWTGLVDKNGNQRGATQVASAILEINNDLVNHETTSNDAHEATAIAVDASDFEQIPATVTNVQEALQSLDSYNDVTLGYHKSTQHSAGVPADQRTQILSGPDGYGPPVVKSYPVQTFVADFPGTLPIDSVVNGDNVIKFLTPASPLDIYQLDAEFSQVKPGDIIRINYGDGVEVQFWIESVRFVPGSVWTVRINGTNFRNTANALARIDRSPFDTNIQAVVAAAASNATPTATFAGAGFLGSIIVADPRVAMAIGNGFDPNKIDENHYKLYLQIYPTGNPLDKVITLPFIDITGNAGSTPGAYTLSGVVESTNNSFRAAGYNYRFIAFEFEGNFGVALADVINGVSFSIINGDASSGVLAEGSYTQNVIGDAADGFDALGLGMLTSAFASPAFRATYPDSTSAVMVTKILMPRTRSSIVDGSTRDFLLTSQNDTDGYYEASITGKTITGTTVEVSYTIPMLLENVGLKTGKTITIQPTIDFSDSLYKDSDYGRFIIKNVIYIPDCCGGIGGDTIITVINGCANNGSALGIVSDVGLNVRLYVGNDSVTFDLNNLIDSSATGVNYHRLHEIYETKAASTFSHERARMPIQVGSGSFLETINFHITDVSPKLRGFLDGALSEFNRRFLRFYLLNYDSITGEFDGYVGQKGSGSNLFNPGPITTSRKNTKTRFYDHTNSDYIELMFVEPSSTPTAILTGVYTDIELFPSLALDDQFLRVATAEINWQPSTGQNIVQNITDKRPVGSISEKEFTETARDYINAGNRFLHNNGIIRGYDLDYVNPLNSREIFFNGGLSLVNGNFINSNEQSVVIPYVYENPPGTLPQTLDWGICVTPSGSLKAVLLTTSRVQTFVKGYVGAVTYLIDSMTLTELLTQRKDLCLIYTAPVTIASFTLGDLADARKYVKSESDNISLSIGSNDSIDIGYGGSGVGEFNSASFKGFKQAISWIKQPPFAYLNGKNIYFKVRGKIVIDEEIDLRSYGGITFDGEEGCLIQITSKTGFRVRSNVEFRNINFVYDGVHSGLTSANLANFNKDDACIFIDAKVSSSTNVKINECSFSRTINQQRVPFIMGSIGGAKSISRCKILNNTFVSQTNDNYNCAIGFYQDLSDAAGLLTDCLIEGNYSASGNSILIVSKNVSFGINAGNLTVCKNSFVNGVLGFRIEGLENEGRSKTKVYENVFTLLGTLDTNGKINTTGSSARGTGLFDIYENSLNFLRILVLNASATLSAGQSVNIFRNKFLSTTTAVASAQWSFADNYGIAIHGDTGGGPPVRIEQNVFIRGTDSYLYDRGVYYSGSAVEINGNTLDKCFSIYGIYGGASYVARITNNNIVRGDTIVTRYIYCSNSPSNTFILNNVIDSTTVDGISGEGTISSAIGSNLFGNVNCILSVHCDYGSCGGFKPYKSGADASAMISFTNSFASDPFADIESIKNRLDGISLIDMEAGSTSTSGARVAILLSSILPSGSKFVSAEVDAAISNSSDWSTCLLQLTLYNTSGTVLLADSKDFVIDTVNTVTCSVSGGEYRVINSGALQPYLTISTRGNNLTGSTKTITIYKLTVKYTY